MPYNIPVRKSLPPIVNLTLSELRFRQRYPSYNSLKILKLSSNSVSCITDNLPWMFSNAQVKS
jgi:hypothetical protein